MKFLRKNGIFLFYLFIIIIFVFFVINIRNSGNKFFLTESEVDLYLNSSYQIEIENPEDDKDDNKYKYISLNEDVASVDENGLVTAKKNGEATIEVQNGVYKETLVVNVKTTDIELTNDEVTLSVGETFDINRLIKNSSEDYEYNFRCNDSILSVDSYGIISAIAKGNATVYIKNEKDEEVSVKVNIVDKVIEAENIELDKVNITLKVGEKTTVTASITPNNTKDKSVTWSSNNDNVSVDKNGHIEAKNVGTSIITARTINGFEAKCTVSVIEDSKDDDTPTITPSVPSDKESASISLNKNEVTLKVGKSYKFLATVKNTSDKVKWSVSDSNIASISSDGVVTAKHSGSTSITATVDGVSANAKVYVINEVVVEKSISLNKSNMELLVGESQSISVNFNPSDTTDKSIVWTSSNESIANYKGGLIVGYKEGKCTITATSKNGKKASVNVTVKKNTIVVTERIDVSETSISIPVGEKKNIIATVVPANATSNKLTWTSSNEKVATVNNGLITAIKEGNCIVSVSNNAGKKVDIEVKVTVKGVPPTGVKLSKASATIMSTEKMTLSATVSPNNADNKTLTWSSSNKSVATVENGVITAKKSGTAKITAKTYNGKTATFNVTVRALNIILIGNSKTYRNPDNYPSVYNVFVSMMDKQGYSISASRSVVGGTSLIEHAKGKCFDSCESNNTSKNNSLKSAKSKLTAKKYDIAVLQEKTGNIYSGINYEDGVKEVIKLLKGKNSSVKLYLRQSWYHTARYKKGEMSYQDKANSNANTIAKNNGLSVIKDGLAFETYYKKYKDTKLFLDDTHGTDEGVYLASLCIYKSITGDNASSVTYRGKVTSSRATLLKNIADEVCK